jgi:hypothetical protein
MSKRKKRKPKFAKPSYHVAEILPPEVWDSGYDASPEAIIIPDVEMSGRVLHPVADDRLLPPLIVGIYTSSGKLIEVHGIPDPRTKFCREVRHDDRFTGRLIALPLVFNPTDAGYLVDIATMKPHVATA